MTKTMRVALGLLLCLVLCVCLLPAAWADGQGAETFAALKAAIANGATYFNMIDCDTVVFTEDITIPSTMHLEARDTLIIIPNGVTMTVEGFNNLGFVAVQPGGHVTVNDTGKANFAVHQGLIFDSVDQFTVNGNMYIDHKVWEDELRNLDLGPNAGVSVAFNVDNNDELLAALNANLDFPNGQFVKWICIGFDCTLTDDFSIDGFDLSVGGSWTDGQPKGSLTIPAGKTLTIVDRLRTEDAPIYLQGIMVNHGQFFVEKIKSTGALLIRSGNGSYYGGDIVVHADMDKRDACLEGFGTSLYKRYVGEWGTSYGVDNSGIFTALKQAIANGDTYFNMDNCGDVVFTEDLRIPQNLKVEGSFTKVIVPENVRLTVLGELWVDDFAILGNCHVQEGGKVCVTNLDANGKQYFEGEVTGGVLNIGDGTEVITVETHYGEGAHLYFNEIHYGEDSRISRNHNVVNATELSGAIAAAQQPHDSHIAEFIRVMFPWTISADMTIPEGISQDNLQVFVMKGLTVNRGATLTVDGVLNCSSPVVFNGAVVNNARIGVPNVQDLSSGAIVKVNGSYSGYGDLAVHDSEELADSYFSGIDLNQFRRILRPGYVYYDAIRNDVFQALKAAIANGATYFNMIDCDTVVFTEDITIPSTMHLEARDTLIIIPNGVTMTVEGFNNLGFVIVQPGGHVTVNDTGKANFAVHQGLIFDSVDQFTVNGNMHIDHKVWEDELRNLDLGPNAGVSVAFNVDNNDELLAALNANLDFPNGQFVKWICIGFDCTLTDDFSIDGFDLSVGGSWTDGQPKGSLTIPAGKTLTIVDRLRTEDAPIYLQGIMVNHGQFFVEKIKSTGALLNISDNGQYFGKEIQVEAPKDQRDACISGLDVSKLGKIINPAYSVYYIPVEVVLPDNLTAIEADAFANGGFHTVYIPAGVTSIDSDAFSGTDLVIIYGVPSTLAEDFADANGVSFMRLPNWYDVHDQQFVIIHTA